MPRIVTDSKPAVAKAVRHLIALAIAMLGIGRPLAAHAGWTSLGPYEGGRIFALAAGPTGTDFAGGYDTGLFRTTNGGTSWHEVNSGLTNPAVWSLAVDPTDASKVYAGLGDAFERSTDGGMTWVEPWANGTVTAIAIDPVNPQVVYGGGLGILRKSTNNGVTWTTVNNDVYILALVIDPSVPTTLYAGNDCHFGPPCGVLKSTDGGVTWNAASAGLPNTSVLALAIDSASPSTLYAGTEEGGALFKSTDGGATWNPAATGIPGDAFTQSILIDPTMPSTIYAGTYNYGVFKSEDGAGTWTQLPTPTLVYALVNALARDSSGALYAGTNKGGVFKSTDGGASWNPVNAGLAATATGAVAVDPVDPSTLYATSTLGGGIFKSTDGGLTWGDSSAGLTGVPGIAPAALAVNPLDTTIVYAASSNFPHSDGTVFKSVDAGASWSATPLSAASPFQAIAVDPTTPSTVFAGAGSYDPVLARSTDAGANWTVVDTDLRVFAIVIDPTNPSIVYAAGVAATGVVVKSVDGGTTWSHADTGLVETNVYKLGLDAANPLTLYAAAYYGVYKTTDGAVTWSKVSNGLPNQLGAFVSIAVDPTHPGTAYVGTTYPGDVFMTTDGGANWAQLPRPLHVPYVATNALTLDPTNPSRLYAATAGGIFAFEAVCGDGVIDLGEQCDAGPANGSLGSCCASGCTLKAASTPCDDGSACTSGDACTAGGTCTGAAVVCALCDACDPSIGCHTAPRTGCRRPTKPLQAKLQIKKGKSSELDTIAWNFSKGAATVAGDFGGLLSTGGAALCLYDTSGPTPSLLTRMTAPGGGMCGTVACWKALKNGFKYKDREATPEGATTVGLQAGAAGKTKIAAKGKGVNLAMPTLPLSSTVTAQVHAATGACWEARYTAAGISKNNSGQYSAKGD